MLEKDLADELIPKYKIALYTFYCDRDLYNILSDVIFR